MIIYTAGLYSSKGSIDDNIEVARKCAIDLWERGFTVICPHLNTAHFEVDCKVGYEDYMRGDLEIIARCDAVVMLPNWELSEGAKQEKQFAISRDIPIYYYGDILPHISDTEVLRPKQCSSFIDKIMRMYRVHLSKNADYCLDKSTLVLTSDLLWIPLSDVKVGDILIGFDEEASNIGQYRRMYRPSVVEQVSTVILPSYELELENGDRFICSSKHPWLTPYGSSTRWHNTEDLQDSNTYTHSSKLIKALDVWDIETTYDAGYLSASLDGEGWLSQQTPTGKNRHKHGKGFNLGFAQVDNPMYQEIIRILDDRDINYQIKNYRNIGNGLMQIIFGKPRRDIIKLLGQVRPKRLLSNLKFELGMVDLRRKIPVKRKTFIGERELISIRTSTKTFMANGYATHNSPANIMGTGVIGLVTRMWDKMARLMNLTGYKIEIAKSTFVAPSNPKHESIDDTIMDLSVYSIIAMIYKEGNWGK